MKAKNRRLFPKSLFIACSATILLPFTSLAQNSYWAAPVSGSGTRDGTWNSMIPNWSRSPNSPATTGWINNGSSVANFTFAEGAALSTSNLIRLGGIFSDTNAPVTIAGPAPLQFTGSLIITVMNAPLSVNSTITGTGGSLNKIGPGQLAIGGDVRTSVLNIQDGLLSLSGGNLTNSTVIQNSADLIMEDSVSAFKYLQSSGTLTGNGTLTLSGGATLTSGLVAGKLKAATVVNGDVEVSGSLDGDRLNLEAGRLLLSGTAKNSTITIGKAASLVNAGGGFVDNLVENHGILEMKTDDSIFKYVQNGGELSGSGMLNATTAAVMNGKISGRLSGTIDTLGNTIVSGTITGGPLTVRSGTLTLAGIATNEVIDIAAGATLVNASGRLDGSETGIRNTGTLRMDADDVIHDYVQEIGSDLTGAATLTTVKAAFLNGGTVSGNLSGATVSSGDVLVSGNIGGVELRVDSGVLKLTGTSDNKAVSIKGGILEVTNGGLSSDAVVTNNATFDVEADDSIFRFIQNNGHQRGEGVLTVINGTSLNGGTIEGKLAGDLTVRGNALVAGQIGGGILSVQTGNLNFTGASTNASVEISKIASLQSTGDLGDTGDIVNSGVLTVNNDDLIGSFVNHGGTLEGTGRLIVAGPAVFNGGNLKGNLFGYGGVTLNDGTSVSGSLAGNIFTRGSVNVSGSLGVGLLAIDSGSLTFTGKSTNPLVRIGESSSLKNSGNLGDFAIVSNAGTLTTTGNDIIGSLINNGGRVDGSGHVIVSGNATFNGGELTGKLTAYSGVTLNDGTSISGTLDGNTTTKGRVSLSGSLDGGNLLVRSGTLHLTGTAKAYTRISLGAALKGTGLVDGDVLNNGILKTNNTGDRTLDISGSLATDGIVKMSLNNASNFDRIKVGAIAALDGRLDVTNLGEGLKTGEVARIIEADLYVGAFDSFKSNGFDNGVLFDDSTGRLIGMAGGASGSAKTYLNLNENQTQVYLSLYEDTVEIDSRNVTSGGSAPKRATRKAADTSGAIEFTSGLSDGDPQLIEALNLATFTNPGSIFEPVINRLSPEVHRGMADYAEQASRAHVREAVEGAPVSRSGKTQIFASAHSSMAGVDSSTTDTGYDLQTAGFTAGIRYDINKRSRIGGLLGADDGSIEGGLVDTDAKGVTIGIFGSHVIDEASKTVLNASLSHSTYDFDAGRQSFQGPVNAGDIDSTAAEISLGVRTVVYEKDGIRISPHGTFRYLDGRVDGFAESGAGVPLKVGKQDIESLLLELGVELEYRILNRLTVAGNIGYITDFSDSSGNITGRFAASGPLARPFIVSAPGVDDEAVVLGLGAFYDINETIRVNFTYRSDFRFDSQDAHSFGIGASFGF